MKIVIVGSGAMGKLFGVFLTKSKHEVILVDVDQKVVDEINHSGIELMGLGESNPDTVQQFSLQAVSDPSTISDCDLILLTVKSHATLAATRSVLHLISETSPVLLLQTGLGNIELVEKLVPRQHMIVAFTFMSGTALGNNRIRHGGTGKTYLGELNGELTPRLEKISGLFTDCGLQNQMVQRIIGRLWCKVIVYSAINSVSSILRIPNGSLLSKMESVTLMKSLVDEGKKVADAHAIDLVYQDLYELLFDACKQSSNNLSSMLQDLLNDRPTEIDAQNGAICRFGEEVGIPTPTQSTMVQLIKLLEKWKPGTLSNF